VRIEGGWSLRTGGGALTGKGRSRKSMPPPRLTQEPSKKEKRSGFSTGLGRGLKPGGHSCDMPATRDAKA